MIVTVTPNPSIDRTMTIPTLVRGEVQRSTVRRVDAGGKGINIARVLRAQGHDATAVLPAGGAEGTQLLALLRDLGVHHRAVRVTQPTRENLAVVEPDGTTTKINEPGPSLTPAEVEELLRVTFSAIGEATWLVTTGSLPPGAPVDLHARIVKLGRAAGVRVALDTSGAALLPAVDAGPDLVKPNQEELAEAVGRSLDSLGDVVDAADELRRRGARAVLVSRGADGVVHVDDDGVTTATSVPVRAVSTVGAGDASLAGALTGGSSTTDRVRNAVAYGAAAVQLPGTQMPGPEHLRFGDVTVAEVLDLRRSDPESTVPGPRTRAG